MDFFLFSLTLILYCWQYNLNSRSSHRRCSVRKGVLRNLTKFTGKHLYQSLFFNKVASCEFCQIFKNIFFAEHLRWLLLLIPVFMSHLRKEMLILTLREKCPNKEFFLVRIFPFSDWIRENTDQKKLRIWTLFTKCKYWWLNSLELQCTNYVWKISHIKVKKHTLHHKK